MRIPYVIDNREHTLADVLNDLLSHFQSRSLDIATAYFTVRGFQLIQRGLESIGSFRLLLGVEPATGEHIGLHPDTNLVRHQLRTHLEQEPFKEQTLRLVEDLVAFLRRSSVQVRLVEKGFLHAKCYLVYGDKPSGQGFLFDRFQPLIGIVGSSNFTGPGLTSNRELNLSHRVLLGEEEADDEQASAMVSFLSDDRASARITEKNRQLLKSEVGARAIMELVNWYDKEWEEARDFKEELIDLLCESKFGDKEYTPYQIYIKALYEYFKDDLETGVEALPKGTAVELTQFQEDAVKKARTTLEMYDGVMIADSVGLGKTWIGKRLLEDYAYHLRQKALVICPASLRDMWKHELAEATIPVTILSQEELGQKDFPADEYGDADLILIDESHNFRNSSTQRYDNLSALIGLNGGRGRDGFRKKLILLTATPISNDLLDLYNQIGLVTQGDRGYFASIGIGDLRRYFLTARRMKTDAESTVALFNLLEEFVVRRTRPFIKEAYPDATIHGEKIRFPDRKLRTVRYDLEGTYSGIYEDIVTGIEQLNLAPYNLETYKKAGVEIDEFEEGRQVALVGIFKSRYLKRFESSVHAFRISMKRALGFQKTFESYLLDGKLLDSTNFEKAMRYLEREGDEDDAVPTSLAEEMDASEEARVILDKLPPLNVNDYDLRKLHEAIQEDIAVLEKIWRQVSDIQPSQDAKLARLKELLCGDLKGKKVIVFTYYRDTARYIEHELVRKESASFRKAAGNPHIRRMDGGNHPGERTHLIQAFAPKSNNKPEIAGTDKEIDILISTDVLSEGQNLQDCGYLVNYDLHWNPTRMVQRAGRIDRIGSPFKLLWVYNMFPDEGLERLLGIVERLSNKISQIDKTGFLDTSVLGEVVHPKNFGTIKRIRDEDGNVIEEEEQLVELASNEFLLQQIKNFIGAEGKEKLEGLPDGIHSGLARRGRNGLFFYFQAPAAEGRGKIRFWKYYDRNTNKIMDNRYLIAQMIACQQDTPRVIGDADVFDIQERVIADILKSYEEQLGLEEAPRKLEPEQQQVVAALEGLTTNLRFKRKALLDLIVFVTTPKAKVQLRELRKVLTEFAEDSVPEKLVSALSELAQKYGMPETKERQRTRAPLRREDLRLICFEHICSA